jgi:hypothetical protein
LFSDITCPLGFLSYARVSGDGGDPVAT